MKVLIDADGCPVRKIVEEICYEKNIELLIFCDTSHIIQSTHFKVITVDKGFDSVDYAIIKELNYNDIVVTQDYGLASLVLAKGRAINQNGMIYNELNINMLLNSRAINQKIRKSGKYTKGPKKRTLEDDKNFIKSFLQLL